MINISKAFAIGFAAIALTAGASAQAGETVDFRYDTAISIQANYAEFERTAKRACDYNSPLYSTKMEQACRADLLDQAVPATKQDAFIAYHQQVIARAI